MNEFITVIANGKPYDVAPGTELTAFIEEQGQVLPRVAVEHNGQALTRAEAAEVALSDGDRLEIVRIVAGG